MPIDFEGLKNNDNAFGNKKGGFKRWKPSSGENVIRLLPPTTRYFDEALNFFTYVYTNHFVPIAKDQFEVFRCLRDEPENPKCPACSFFFKHRNSEDEDVQKMAKRFNASSRHIMNMLVIETEDGKAVPEGTQIFECGPGVYEDMKLVAANKRHGDIFDPEEGRNIIIDFTPANDSNTNRNKYRVYPDTEQSSVVHLLGDNWKEKIDELESHVPEFPTVEYVQQVVEAAADLVGLSYAPSRRVVSAGSPVSEPSDTSEDVSVDDDSDEENVSVEAEGSEFEDELENLLDGDDLEDLDW